MPGIHHVTAISGDPVKNLRFYTHDLGLRFVKNTVNFDDPGHYAALNAELERISSERGIGNNRLFYLATAPEFFTGIVENLGAQGMAHTDNGHIGVVTVFYVLIQFVAQSTLPDLAVGTQRGLSLPARTAP